MSPPNYGGCNEAGCINCNVPQGSVFTCLCDKSCDAPCTDAHEGQHRYDMRRCCSNTKVCFDRNHGDPRCEIQFHFWESMSYSYLQCRGFSSGRDCSASHWN